MTESRVALLCAEPGDVGLTDCGAGTGRDYKRRRGDAESTKEAFWIPLLRLDYRGWRGNGRAEMHMEHI